MYVCQLSDDFFRAWYSRFESAASVVEGRVERINAVAAEIETDLTVVGATAIEDKLQVLTWIH
jgi:magnesium-transporting ATPase (P-type)